MKKLLMAMLLASMPLAANAWEFDMSTITCTDMAEDEELGQMMIFWLDGYISAAKSDTNISEEWIDKLGNVLGDACGKDPNRKLLNIVQEELDNN